MSFFSFMSMTCYLALAPDRRTLAVGLPDGYPLFVDPNTGEKKDLFP